MYIEFQQVWGWQANFSKVIHPSRDDALRDDLASAVEIVKGAYLHDVETAARTGEGVVYEAMKFLANCKYDLQMLAEREAAEVKLDDIPPSDYPLEKGDLAP